MTDTTLPPGERDVLVLAKTVGTSDFPVERPSIVGVDRESGRLVRLAPFPWRGNDTEPPITKWSWLHLGTAPDDRDVRPETLTLEGEVATTGYVEPKDAWRLRWPFVRPHLHGSLDSLRGLAKERAATLGFVKVAEADVVQLPLRYRFRCASEECLDLHELPMLDWELQEMARLSRERYGQQWATKFRSSWGAPLVERFDVHVLVSSYAQQPTRFYVAGLFTPPREAEDAHAHAHHVEHHREHVTGG